MQRIAGLTLPGLLLCASIGAFMGAGSYTAWYGEGFSYLSNDPKACVNCHIMRDHYDGWQKASHHGVATCNDCHIPHELVPKYLVKAENGFWHSKGFTLQDFPEPIRIREKNRRVLEENCVACHRELTREITAHAPLDGSLLGCVHCHRHVGHGPSK